MLRERLIQFIKSQHLTVSKFEQIVGLSNGAVSRTNDKIRQRTLFSISDKFPSLNIDWLLTGEGEMLKSDRDATSLEMGEHQLSIPLIHIDSVGGIHTSNELTPSEQYTERMIPFPNARSGDVAILQSGNSMAPTIPAGAILQIRRVEGWREYFGYGGDFVLWLADDRRITKQILKSREDPKEYVLCHSYNPESADEELPKSMIQEVWKVVNVLINKGW